MEIHNYNKFLESKENICYEDIFDMDSIYNYVEFEKPLYSIINKRKTAQLKFITPMQYIYRIAHGFGISYEETVNSNIVDKQKIEKYKKDMLNGDKFPVIYYTENSNYQEGRHRAMAAMDICDVIPVIKFKSLTKEEVDVIAKYLIDKDKESINLYLKNTESYFKDITQLGYRDLQKYIEFQL